MTEFELLMDILKAWECGSKDRDAFIRWSARHDLWTVSARDGRTGKAFANSGNPGELITYFRQWERSL